MTEAPDGDAGGATPPTDGGWRARLAPELLALAAGAAALAASYAVAGATGSFVAAPIATLVVEFTPDIVVTLSITLLGDLGKQLALVTALGLTTAVLGLAARPGVRLARDMAAAGGLLGGVVVAAVTGLVTGSPASAAAAGAAAAVTVAVPHVVPDERAAPAGRRQLLAAVGTALGTGLLGVVVAPGEAETEAPGGDEDGEPTTEVGQMLQTAEERSLDVEGLEGLVSSSFYVVDVAQFDPKVSTDEWSLSVTGAVENERTYQWSDIAEREFEHRFESLRCVGDKLNGGKLDNAVWTGVPLWDLVEPANPQGEYVMLRAKDDFYEEFPTEAMRDGMLAVGMNGQGLPREHGAPARALIPGHWGEINVKWIDEIEILERPAKGYWEERGWHGTGPVNTVAKLWVKNELDDGRIEVAGHAYAGTRGVSAVEVSTDGGGTWSEAELSERLPGDDVWRQWVYRYDPPDGAHEVVVRAIDDDGNVQPKEESDSYPSGPSGWVSQTVNP